MRDERRFGLRAYSDRVKGAGLRWRLTELYWQLRYAWQRAWYGYDDTDVFELSFNFVARMPVLLREFKENNIALFPDLEHPGESLTEAETDAIIDQLIFYFENCSEDHVYKRLYGVNYWEEEFDFEKHKAAAAEQNACWEKAMELFAKWSMCLWY